MSVQDCTIFCTLVGRLTFTESDCDDLETRFARDCTCADDPIARAGTCLPSLCTPAQVAAVEAGEAARCGTSSVNLDVTPSVVKRAVEAIETQAGSGDNMPLTLCNHSAITLHPTRPVERPIGTALLLIVGVILFGVFVLGRGCGRKNTAVPEEETEGGLLPVKQTEYMGMLNENTPKKKATKDDTHVSDSEVFPCLRHGIFLKYILLHSKPG
ncbi:hypothetical protein C8Q79DRAFT_735376 [Trametes meyenii]|nr:hypothetical protein C8Q79DRAFT_735376 [Trametes meyenii]